ncbi:succinyl-diaminopimelate desuccinylase [Fodinibius saliphilus]|uniref:succinyl-diaminopimelate desuccinylase n=1 Tax=Fodinibius saliphilus TaxID=1920650 RepID=UPI0011095AD7|nr:succinyl-diaminopimelate desuccinylase [Fodinibius saliphilus]
MIERAIKHITGTAQVPSFSSYEERLHPYINAVVNELPQVNKIEVHGNNLLYKVGDQQDRPTIALAAHLDKINHYGDEYPQQLPVKVTDDYIEGAMDDCAGLGMLLTIAEMKSDHDWPNLLLFFSEMEESKGLKEHPELLKNNGSGYTHGMGAKRIATHCVEHDWVPDEVITLDTTPLFKGEPGIALYSKHWEYNDLEPSESLIEATEKTVGRFIRIDARIKIDNNTNDYLHYGEVFNNKADKAVVSVALEPAIYPYHQKGERVFIRDIERTLNIVSEYLNNYSV